MDFDCVICGTPVNLPSTSLGCTVFCEECYSKPELIEWYREERRKKLEAMNRVA